jgi:hypothetical protein
VGVGIDIEGVIRTSLHAAAADATPLVEIHNAVIAPVQSRDRTNFDARRIIAMIASASPRTAAACWGTRLFDIFHPGAIDACRHLVLGFASDGAGMAADALAVVDDEAKVHVVLRKVVLAPCGRFLTPTILL